MTFSIDEVFAEAESPRASTKVCFRRDLVERHEDLEADLQAAQTQDAMENRLPAAPAIAQAIVDLEAEMQAAQREFVFEAVGKRRWSDLLAEHPPRAEDRGLDHNPVTFPSAALAASCVQPVMTVDEAGRLEDLLTIAQWLKLWNACLKANVGGGGDTPKSLLATAVLQASGASSTTAANGASLAASS